MNLKERIGAFRLRADVEAEPTRTTLLELATILETLLGMQGEHYVTQSPHYPQTAVCGGCGGQMFLTPGLDGTTEPPGYYCSRCESL